MKNEVALDEYTLSDLEVLADARVPMHEVAPRLGYAKVDTMIRNLYRVGRPDLVEKLRIASHSRGYSVHGKTLTR